MSERTENLGRRVELRRERQRLTAECDGLRGLLRRQLPLDVEVDDLDGEGIFNAALALRQSLMELSGINRRLAVLNRELGD